MDKQQLALAIVKALAYTENGGKPDIKRLTAGKTGEMKSIFQFTPDTWKNYSKQIFGKEVKISPEAESEVVHKKVSQWLDQGYEPKQIASMWNAGTGEPNAYSGKFSNGQKSKGINPKYGVKFDVPSYANKVESYTNKFINETVPKDPNQVAVSTPKTLPGIVQQSIQPKIPVDIMNKIKVAVEAAGKAKGNIQNPGMLPNLAQNQNNPIANPNQNIA